MKKNLQILIYSCLIWFLISTSHAVATVKTHIDSPPDGSASPILASSPPTVSDEDRRRELAGRRANVAAKIGTGGVLVLFGAEPRIYSNDVDYVYRQENNFFYLTGLNQEGSKLVLMPGETAPFREILFLPRRNSRAETWTGKMYSPEDARRISGIEEIWDTQEFDSFIQELRRNHSYRPAKEKILSISSVAGDRGPSNRDQGATTDSPLITAAKAGHGDLYLLIPGQRESREFRQEQQFAAQWTQTSTGFVVRTAVPVFSAMRMQKSDVELKYLQYAIDITTEAISRAMAMTNHAQWEYQVQAEVEYTFRRRNADYWGYPSIVGCGANSTTLHYEEAQGKVTSGSVLLMDVGAEYNHYSADVTR
ncbi:MAG: aminopeptidase P N-terminal domain-containing protein, partial [Pyrinomonadaceae bacterium]